MINKWINKFKKFLIQKYNILIFINISIYIIIFIFTKDKLNKNTLYIELFSNVWGLSTITSVGFWFFNDIYTVNKNVREEKEKLKNYFFSINNIDNTQDKLKAILSDEYSINLENTINIFDEEKNIKVKFEKIIKGSDESKDLNILDNNKKSFKDNIDLLKQYDKFIENQLTHYWIFHNIDGFIANITNYIFTFNHKSYDNEISLYFMSDLKNLILKLNKLETEIKMFSEKLNKIKETNPKLHDELLSLLKKISQFHKETKNVIHQIILNKLIIENNQNNNKIMDMNTSNESDKIIIINNKISFSENGMILIINTLFFNEIINLIFNYMILSKQNDEKCKQILHIKLQDTIYNFFVKLLPYYDDIEKQEKEILTLINDNLNKK